MKSKNKLVPRLLGITKESVMRVDERTKDVVQEWPLTTVKRWAASPKSFTLVRHADRRPAVFLDRFISLPSAVHRRLLSLCSTQAELQDEGQNEPVSRLQPPPPAPAVEGAVLFIPSRTSLTEQPSFVFPLGVSASCPHQSQ